MSSRAIPDGITRDNWMYHERNNWAFQNISRLNPTAVIHRGSGPIDHFVNQEKIDGSFEIDPKTGLSLKSALEQTFTNGFLVLHKGQLQYEAYLNGFTEDQEQLVFSVTKSVTAALMACLQKEGLVNPTHKVENYISDLPIHSGFYGATVQNVVDMTVGVKFEENSTDPSCERIIRYAHCWGGVTADVALNDYRSWLMNLPKNGPHGGHFTYMSACTDMLGLILEEATGKAFPELLEKYLWQYLGMENNASITVEPGGCSMTASALSVTSRDLARFGLFLSRGGVTHDGQKLFSEGWIENTRKDADIAAFSKAYEGDPEQDLHHGFSYRNSLWNTPDPYGGFLCVGIFGQWIYMAPKIDLVIVKLSAYREAKNQAARAMTYKTINCLTQYFKDK